MRGSGAHYSVQLLIDAGGYRTVCEFARAIGVGDPQVFSALRRGGVRIHTADRWATRCGFHPAEVWPNWLQTGRSEALSASAAAVSP